MVFTINKNFLHDELIKANKIVDPKANVPSLSGVLIEVNTDDIQIKSTNGSLSLKLTIDSGKHGLEIKEIGSLLIRAKYLIDILGKMDDTEVTLSVIESNLLKINGVKNEFNLSILNYEDFPLIGFRENGVSLDIDNSELKKSISQTIISVFEYNQKVFLTGLNFNVEGDSLYIAGTDSFRVSRKIVSLDKSFENRIVANIPYKSCLELIRILDDKEKCKVIFFDDYVSFISNNVVFQTTVLEGTFPEMNNLFPTDFNTTVFVENKVFSKLISRADIPNDETSSTVVSLSLQGDIIYVKSSIPQIGSFEEEFKNFQLKGIDELTIGVNSKYILDALKSFETKTIEISFIDNKRPIVINSSEYKNLCQIILPMNIN